MTIDVASLKTFYNSPLGRATIQSVDHCIHTLWPDLTREAVLGMGYPLPYLESYLDRTERLMVFMPAYQGVTAWPHENRSVTALVNEEEVPLPDQSVSRILLIHSLEHARNLRSYLRELWRILKSEGRILIIVPNRRGLWAQVDKTPFGQGQPYTMTQLRSLLEDNMFISTREERALYLFPSASACILSSQSIVERCGKCVFRKLSGVVCMEVMKQTCAGAPKSSKKRLSSLPKLAGI